MSTEARTPERRLAVVVPVHDEELLLGRCLDAVAVAVDALTRARPAWRTRVVVVLDRCRDASAAVAAAAGVDTLDVDLGRVGAARHAGVEHAARLLGGPAAGLWVAGTDADTVVAPDWLTRQADVAEQGGALVVGRVVPDAADLSPSLMRAWLLRHPSGVGPTHVHGANLGFSLEAYRRVGGFPATAEHEDRHLVDAMLAAGLEAHPGAVAVTSGRRTGRTPGGFSGYLRRLEAAAAEGLPLADPSRGTPVPENG